MNTIQAYFRTSNFLSTRKEKDKTIEDLTNEAVNQIYKSHGYYSALAFLINNGLASRSDYSAAVAELESRIK